MYLKELLQKQILILYEGEIILTSRKTRLKPLKLSIKKKLAIVYKASLYTLSASTQ